MRKCFSHLLLVLMLHGFCYSASSHAEPANLSKLTEEIKAYHDSGTYEKELTAVIKKAHQYILARSSQKTTQPSTEKLAIVLDIDETSLSNYPHMVSRHFVANKKQLHQEILAADAPPLKATLALYNDAIKRGIAVFFVTGRHQSERRPTELNLQQAGYKNWTGLFLKPTHYHLPSIVPFKSSARQAITKKGYTIIASIGDQLSDISGGFTEKGFKLPNPYYFLP